MDRWIERGKDGLKIICKYQARRKIHNYTTGPPFSALHLSLVFCKTVSIISIQVIPNKSEAWKQPFKISPRNESN